MDPENVPDQLETSGDFFLDIKPSILLHPYLYDCEKGKQNDRPHNTELFIAG